MFKKFKDIDYLVHIAADIGGIGYNINNSSRIFYNNILLNTYVLHYAWKNKVKKFIGIGSVCEYPSETKIPFKEDTIWNGYPVKSNAAYGLSKRMLYAQSIAYNRDYNFNCIHLLPVNLYGPGDNFSEQSSHVIPALIRKIHNAKVQKIDYVEVWGTGDESREFIYVKDCAEAIYKATLKYNKINAINLGSGREITIKELCILISDKMNYNGNFKFIRNGFGGQKRRMLDVSLAKKEIDFTAMTSLEKGIEETIKYFYENIDKILLK